MTARDPDPEVDESPRRCDYCRLPCPTGVVTLERDTVYSFCSRSCRDAMLEGDRVFTEYHGFRRIQPSVSALTRGLPQGLPRNAFVLLLGQAGTRDGALHAELVWRALRRGERAVFVTFQEPPVSVVQRFLTLEWNVLPYLESGDLNIVDCFTYRVEDRERLFERMNAWNRHLSSTAAAATVAVRDPSDMAEVQNKLDNCLEDLSMSDRGIVLVDSLTEVGSLVQPVQAYDFVKDVRAEVCKGRSVPIFAGATRSTEGNGFPHDLDYMVDGVIDMELNGSIVDDTLIKRIRVRKMSGVLTIPEWTAYEYTAGDGMICFDPRAQIEAARRDERGEDSDGVDEDANGESVDGRHVPDDAVPDDAGAGDPLAGEAVRDEDGTEDGTDDTSESEGEDGNEDED